MEARFKKMAARCSKDTTFLLLIMFALFLGSNVVQGSKRLSKEEDLKLERQLQLINKPAIKSFQTKYGDILDCVDIYKQHAFDHPLLKNHAIQMKPKTIPKGMKDEGSRTNVFPAYSATISCPRGSIPVKRTTKEDLIMDKYQNSAGRNHLNRQLWFGPTNNQRGFHAAAVAALGESYGARAAINVWSPTISTAQFSRANIKVTNASDVLSAGWEVRKWNYTRLYVSRSGNGVFGTECINLACPGFVQVNRKIALGGFLPSSTVNGHQYEIRISLFRDNQTGNWWFKLRDQYIGYWPRALLPNLAHSARKILWGGHVFSPKGQDSPAMGSGRFPQEGYGKTAFIRAIQILYFELRGFTDPFSSITSLDVDPYCYYATYNKSTSPVWGRHLFFGGPGKCAFK